jgi:gas vesicle protein
MNGGNTMTKVTNRSGFLQGILIGGAVATALLYTPKAVKYLHKKITDFFQTTKQSIGTAPAPVLQTINSMAHNEHEMFKLGEEMKHMETNTQVKHRGMVPDPIQNE